MKRHVVDAMCRRNDGRGSGVRARPGIVEGRGVWGRGFATGRGGARVVAWVLGVVAIGTLMMDRAAAQCPAGWASGGAVMGVGGAPNAIVTLPNGDIVVGGSLGIAGDVAVGAVARWSRSTQTWSPLGSGVSGNGGGVVALALLPDGDIIVGGNFTTAGGQPASNIARWSPATQTWSALGSGVNNIVRSLTVLPSGDVIAGGQFFMAGGIQANKIARWNVGTQTWSALGSGIAETPGGTSVRSLLALPNGDVIAGGVMGTAGGVPVINVARWNGSAWSAMGTGLSGGNFGGAVTGLATLSNGDIVASGDFTMAGATQVGYIARWDSATGEWMPMDGGLNNRAYGVARLASGDVIAGGSFTSAGGVAVNRIARWDTTNGGWSPVGTGMPSRVFAVAVGADGTVFAGGEFVTAGGAPAAGIAQWTDADGWAALNSGTSAAITSLLALPGGDAVAAGGFLSIAGVPAGYIARRDGITGGWTALGSGMNHFVNSLALHPDGDIVAGGTFSEAGGMPAGGIARWDGTSWTGVTGGPPNVRAIAVTPSGDVIAAGGSTLEGSTWRTRIERWDGSEWSEMGGGVSGTNFVAVYALAVLPNGEIIAGGEFQYAGGVPANSIARWTGTSWAPMGVGSIGAVHAIAVRPDGTVIAGGYFNTGTEHHWIAQWNGSAWSRIGNNSGLNGAVREIMIRDDGDLIVGGEFTFAGSITVSRIVRWNSAAGAWAAVGSGMNGNVVALADLATGELAAGGYFTTAGGVPSAYFSTYRSVEAGAPGIESQPQPVSGCVGSDVAFEVVASGAGPFGYQWRKNGMAIDGASNPSAASATLTLAGVTYSDTGVYDCVVASVCGGVTSEGAGLTIGTDCRADINCDGVVNSQDFFDFLGAFFTGDADFNGSGATNSQDYFDFLGAFFEGC